MLLFASLAAAGVIAPENPPPPFRMSCPAPLDALELDAAVCHDFEDGLLWSRGARWKMSFGAAGATFFPLFGRAQERHHPLALSPAALRLGGSDLPLEREAQPERCGDRVTFERGSLLEVYRLFPEGVEQSFLFNEVPRGGDLTLELRTGTDLPGVDGTQALELRHALGRLEYSQAVAIDALGRRLPLETRLAGDAIRIVVPAWFLDLAAAPLLVDPLLSVFTVAGSDLYDEVSADVAYDATTQRWLVVWERLVTASDSDVVYGLFTDSGSPISSGYLNLGADSWSQPVVANLNAYDMFYVAAQVPWLSPSSRIKGRALSATAPPFSSGGPVYQLSSSAKTKLEPQIDSEAPAVGGDPSPDPAHTRFCVTWWQRVGTSPASVHYRLVDSLGVPAGPPTALSTGGYASAPGISASNGGTEWTLTYTASDSLADSYRLMLARLRWDGVLSLAPQQLLLADLPLGLAKVSDPMNGRQIVSYSPFPYVDIHVLELEGLAVLDEAVVVPYGADYQSLNLATDAGRFVLGLGSYPSYYGYGNVELVSLLVVPGTDTLAIAEHLLADPWAGASVRLASRFESNGQPGKLLCAWSRGDINDIDVLAAFYQAE